MSRKSFLLPEKLSEYYHRVALREPPLFAQLREETAALPQAVMQIAPEQAQLMGLLRHEVQKGIDSSNGGKNSRPLDEVFASLLKRRRKPAPTKRRQAVEA